MFIPSDRLVYVPKLGEDIPFPTASDAKIARLAFSGGLLAQTIDLVLDIIQDETFELEEMTIRRAVDIFRHVSDFRTKRAIDRTHRQICGGYTNLESDSVSKGDPELAVELASAKSRTQTFSALVLELVVDSILQESRHIMKMGRFSEDRELLRTMSLVHRSWTYPSQRALAESIEVDISRGMRQYVCSPSLFLAHTKHLGLRLLNDVRWDSPTARFPVSNEGSYLSSFVFSQLSNLRYLRLDLDDIANGRNVLGSLELNAPCIELLEELWIHISSRALAEIVCPIVSDFPMLKTFGLIVSEDLGADSLIPASRPLNSVRPGAKLECVCLKFLVQRIAPFVPTVKWLLAPRNDGQSTIQLKSLFYTDLFLTMHQDGAIFNTILDMSPCPSLMSMELHCAFSKYTDKFDILHSIVHKFKKLRRLGICDPRARGTVPPDEVLQLIGSVPEVYYKRSYLHSSGDFCLFEECHRI